MTCLSVLGEVIQAFNANSYKHEIYRGYLFLLEKRFTSLSIQNCKLLSYYISYKTLIAPAFKEFYKEPFMHRRIYFHFEQFSLSSSSSIQTFTILLLHGFPIQRKKIRPPCCRRPQQLGAAGLP